MALLDEVMELAEAMVAGLPDRDRDTFWRCLSNAAGKRIRQRVQMKPDKPGPAAMTEEEAISFEKTIIPLGHYKGEQVRMAPLEYLANLSDDVPFIRDLKRYVRSCRYAGRCRLN